MERLLRSSWSIRELPTPELVQALLAAEMVARHGADAPAGPTSGAVEFPAAEGRSDVESTRGVALVATAVRELGERDCATAARYLGWRQQPGGMPDDALLLAFSGVESPSLVGVDQRLQPASIPSHAAFRNGVLRPPPPSQAADVTVGPEGPAAQRRPIRRPPAR